MYHCGPMSSHPPPCCGCYSPAAIAKGAAGKWCGREQGLLQAKPTSCSGCALWFESAGARLAAGQEVRVSLEPIFLQRVAKSNTNTVTIIAQAPPRGNSC
jgi:hypothetical protein